MCNVITIATNVDETKNEDCHMDTQIGSDHLEYLMPIVNQENRILTGYAKNQIWTAIMNLTLAGYKKRLQAVIGGVTKYWS